MKDNTMKNIDEIIAASDGIMIARGDLGVEAPMEQIPFLQKAIIKECRRQGKFCIVATEMLESMKKNSRPTRAEVSDIANAVINGTDAVMLSGETTTGKFPSETVKYMADICEEAEKHLDYSINKYGEDIARLYLEAQIDACEEYNALCQNIECNYEKKNSYVYSLQSIRIVDFVSEIVNANRYDAIFVQTKTREPPRQRYGRTLSAIPKPIHHRQVNQPYNSTRVKIDGTAVFSFGHFHRFRKNGDTGLTTLGRVSFVIPPSFIFPYVCMVCNSSFLN